MVNAKNGILGPGWLGGGRHRQKTGVGGGGMIYVIKAVDCVSEWRCGGRYKDANLWL